MMEIKIARYVRDASPWGLLGVVKDVLQTLLNGFSYALHSGITVVFPKSDEVSLETLDRRDALGEKAMEAFHPVCVCWRDANQCDQEGICALGDKQSALRHFQQTGLDPRVYACEPLGLLDMTYPLRVEGQVVGVLFGGQIIVDSGREAWREPLEEFKDIVDWESCPEDGDHVASIEAKISHSSISAERKELMRNALQAACCEGQIVSPGELRKRIRDFLRFGEMAQALLGALHQARKTAAEQQLLRGYSQALDAIPMAEPEAWWLRCGKILRRLTILPDIDNVRLYTRDRSRFVAEISEPGVKDRIRPVHARAVVPALASGRLVSLSGKTAPDLIAVLNMGNENLWAYRSKVGTGSEQSSTVIVLRGDIPTERQDFVEGLCGIVGMAADAACRIFRQRDAEEQFRHRVSVIGHSFRTPLQAVQFILEDVLYSARRTNATGLAADCERGMDRIADAKEDLAQLLEFAHDGTEDVDLIEILRRAMQIVQPLAARHPCDLIEAGNWPRKAVVHVNRYRIQRALLGLLDNAVKYSYGGRRGRGGVQPYHVDVKVSNQGEFVRTLISNYGIGIPKGKLVRIREYGGRGGVTDYKRDRGGSGIGLPYAIDEFAAAGGWIHITSRPADSATDEEIRRYKRFVTVIEAALPRADGEDRK